MASSIERARSGDDAAFRELVQEHGGRLFQQACALCGDSHLAEDLVQETFLAAWKGLARYDGSCRFSTWLYAILLRRFWKVRHKARAAGDREKDMPAPAGAAGDDPVQAASAEERRAWLREAVDALSELHREVVLLRFFDDASLNEIAAALAVPLGTVKSRLHNALEELRRATDLDLP